MQVFVTHDGTFQTHLRHSRPQTSMKKTTWMPDLTRIPGTAGASHQRISAAVGETREAGLPVLGHHIQVVPDSQLPKTPPTSILIWVISRVADAIQDHACIKHIVDSIKNFCERNVHVQCADGQVKAGYPYLSRCILFLHGISWFINRYTADSQVLCDWNFNVAC